MVIINICSDLQRKCSVNSRHYVEETRVIGMKKTQYMKNGYIEIKRQKNKRLKVYIFIYSIYTMHYTHTHTIAKEIEGEGLFLRR